MFGIVSVIVRIDNLVYNVETYIDTDMTGTVRANRKNLPVAMKNKVQKGEVRYFQKVDILALKWHDKKDVRLLLTVARPHNLTTVHGRTHTEVNNTIICIFC